MGHNGTSADDIRATYDGFTEAYARIWGDDLHVGYWDAGAPDVDVPTATDRLNSELLERLVTHPGDRVLDAGCGIGNPALRLARERDVSVAGVTISGYQVQRATEAAAAAGLADRVTFSETDVRSMPFDAAWFNAVWAMESLHHVPDRAVALTEIHRVLRPGGYLAMADFALSRTPTGADAEVIAQFSEAGGVATLTTFEGLLADLRVAGLELVSLTDVGDRVRPTMTRHAELFRRARPQLEPRMGVVALDEMIKRNEELAASPAFSYVLLAARRPVPSASA
nr:RebM-like putative D-glucose O-methyltransferase [uncultured bacterium]